MSGEKISPDLNYPLPQITPEQIEALAADGLEVGLAKLLVDSSRQMEIDNPELKNNVDQMIENIFKSKEERAAAWAAATITHELIRRQAAAEEFNAEFLDSPTSD